MPATDHAAVRHDLRPAITAMMRDAAVPGLSIAVVRDDRLLYADAFGWANLATRTSATTATSYLWFSMSKIATATAAMRLADEGRLDLDAPLAEYVGYLRAPGDTQPTTRQLLTHTAGLPNPLPIRWVHAAADAGPGPEVLLRRFVGRRRTFRHQIGGPARYTNIGYLAAAQVIAAAAGRPFEEYVCTAVLEPAGMTATAFAYQPQAPAATGYLRAPRGTGLLLKMMLPKGIVGQRRGRYLGLGPFLVDGAGYGGLVGHVLDAGRFLRLHLGDGRIDGHCPQRRSQPGHAPGRGPRQVVRPRYRLVPQTCRLCRPLRRAFRRRGRILERHAALPRQQPRHRGDDQQHDQLPIRSTLPAPDPRPGALLALHRRPGDCSTAVATGAGPPAN
jgi:CubicO group peptidase (beta-lactamase class C family)